MRRFDYDDNEEHREEVDRFFGGEPEDNGEFLTPEEYKSFIDENRELQRASFDLAVRDVEDRFLFRIVKMLERSFWWRFYSHETRMKMIEKTYKRMKRISEKG